jgi:transposase
LPAASPDRSGRASGVQKNFPAAVEAAIPEAARGKPLELWFQDEARVGQQGTLTRIWARRGTRPRAPRDTRCQWACCNLVERFFNQIQRFRRIALRCEKTVASFTGFVALACAIAWLA